MNGIPLSNGNIHAFRVLAHQIYARARGHQRNDPQKGDMAAAFGYLKESADTRTARLSWDDLPSLDEVAENPEINWRRYRKTSTDGYKNIHSVRVAVAKPKSNGNGHAQAA